MLRTIFPTRLRGWIAWGALTLLAVFRVLGQHRVRVGSFIPDVSLWWFLILLPVVILWITPSPKKLVRHAAVAAVLLLILSALPLTVWLRAIESSSPPKQALVSTDTEPILMSSLQIEERKYLNRLTGRRRNVRLVVEGFLHVPQPGSYRFELDCDDRCALFIYGEEIVTGKSRSGEKELEQGFHPLELRYEQDGGPAQLSVGWDGPETIELLPLDHYVTDRLATLLAGQRKARAQVLVSVVLNMLWWIVGLGLLVRVVESVRHELASRLLPGWDTALGLSLVCALAVPLLDLTVFGSPNRQAPPVFSASELLRSILLLASALAFVYAMHIQGMRRKEPPARINELARRDTLFAVTRWPLLLFAAALPWVHVWSPELFSRLGREDGIVENLSALLALVACSVSLVAAWRLHGSRRSSKGHVFLLAGLAGVFFLISMEEISWGQRIFGFESPTPYLENVQHETNIHNVATEAFENLYYSLATVLLIVAPFVQDRTKVFSSLPAIAFFVPGLSILFLSAPLASYNYNLWTAPHIQLLFFLTVAILTYYFVQDRKSGGFSAYIFLLALGVVTIQAVFLIEGGFIRHWELTEFKEFFIPLGFVLYSVDLLRRAREASGK
jgi:hypothetical protein